MPRRTIRSGSVPSTRRPSNTISPRVTAPFSDLSKPEMALSVVDLPAPLAPSSATTEPCGTVEAEPAQHQDHLVIDDLDAAHRKQRLGARGRLPKGRDVLRRPLRPGVSRGGDRRTRLRSRYHPCHSALRGSSVDVTCSSAIVRLLIRSLSGASVAPATFMRYRFTVSVER